MLYNLLMIQQVSLEDGIRYTWKSLLQDNSLSSKEVMTPVLTSDAELNNAKTEWRFTTDNSVDQPETTSPYTEDNLKDFQHYVKSSNVVNVL